MINLLAQLYNPNSPWYDTPQVLRTPKQNADMFIAVIQYAWPLFVLALAFALWQAGADSRKDRRIFRIFSFVCTVIGGVGFFKVYFG